MTERLDSTSLLKEIVEGNALATERLLPAVYTELRRLAAQHMRRERPDHTLQPTALVHEAYLKLIEQRHADWQSRAHFFAIASQLMRRILVDHARRHARLKRGGKQEKLVLDEARIGTKGSSAELLALDESLTEVAELDPRQCRIVELRFFGGLSVKETAEVLGISPKTVKRDWAIARAWLFGRLRGDDEDHSGKVGADQGVV